MKDNGKEKMFFLFCGDSDCAGGGMSEYIDSYKTIEEAKQAVKEVTVKDWAEVVIVQDGALKVICSARWAGPTVHCHDWKDET